jgi:hypothetical protein
MLGAPLDGPIWMFGDNKSMINSAAEPAGQLTKRHLILSWHQLREKAAMGMVHYLHIGSKENIADCLTKHLAHTPMWALIKEHQFTATMKSKKLKWSMQAKLSTKLQTGSIALEIASVQRMVGRSVKDAGMLRQLEIAPTWSSRCKSYVQANAGKADFWHKKTG